MPPASKTRKTKLNTVEEIIFDPELRQEYLTGFHKRKRQRAKHAQEVAEKKARAERIEERRKLREERRKDLERHLAQVNASLDPTDRQRGEASSMDDSEGGDGWSGISDTENVVNQEAEYVDEDRYTTVTIEAMDVSRAGLQREEEKLKSEHGGSDEGQQDDIRHLPQQSQRKQTWTKEKPQREGHVSPKRRKDFRYENKGERKVTRIKETSKNRRHAKARRAG